MSVYEKFTREKGLEYGMPEERRWAEFCSRMYGFPLYTLSLRELALAWRAFERAKAGKVT